MSAQLRQHIDLVEWAETAARTEWEALKSHAGKTLSKAAIRQLAAKFPHIEDLTSMLCPDAAKMEISLIKAHQHDHLYFRYGDAMLDMFLQWRLGDDEIWFNNVDMHGLQQGGLLFVRRLMRRMFKAIRLLGIRRIRMLAEKDGSFMWAKLGFLPDPDGNKVYLRFLQEHGLGSFAEGRTEREIAELIWKVADHPSGREWLTGLKWTGYFDLDDREQVERFLGKQIVGGAD